jgi:hypothetical protein
MKVLDKDEKAVYDEFMKTIKMEKVDYSNIETPEDWLFEIKDLKINDELK